MWVVVVGGGGGGDSGGAEVRRQIKVVRSRV